MPLRKHPEVFASSRARKEAVKVNDAVDAQPQMCETGFASAEVGPLTLRDDTEEEEEVEEEVDNDLMRAKHISVIDECFRCINAHDMKTARQLQTDDVVWVFRDVHGNLVHQMSWDEFEAEMAKLFGAFPDFCFTWKEIIQDPSSEDVMKLLHVVASGTHTGGAFAFGPCEPIQASGKCFQNDPEDVTFTFRDGKLCKHEIRARGEMTGPAGIYSQLGGFPLLGGLPPAFPTEGT